MAAPNGSAAGKQWRENSFRNHSKRRNKLAAKISIMAWRWQRQQAMAAKMAAKRGMARKRRGNGVA